MSNLSRVYARILVEFGLDWFSSEKFKETICMNGHSLILHRLCEKGYVTRLSRGFYRATHPLILILEEGGWRWRSQISQKEYLPIIEFVVARLFDAFWKKLISLVVFGSVACGKARRESDIDFLVVVEGLPERYSERLNLLRKILAGVEDVRIKIWREKGKYPLLDIIILNPQEALTSHPFYLDMVEESIIVFDRKDFMKNKLESLKRRLHELGAKKIMLPDGRWYWDLKTEIAKGEVIQL